MWRALARDAPDLAASPVTTNPPAPATTLGPTLWVTDTVENRGSAPSGSSTTRYYLSLDAAKIAGDTLLTGGRSVPALSPGGQPLRDHHRHIPSGITPNTYLLLAGAGNGKTVAKTNETNNSTASGTRVTITP